MYININMSKSALVRVDGKTYKILKEIQVKTGVPMGKQIRFKVFGRPCKVKRLGEK